jgi:hypothetical protein
MTDVDGTDEPNTMGRGVTVGAAITVGSLIMLGFSLSLHPGGIAQRVALGLTVTTIMAAYLSGLACAVHRPLRRLGIGILVGLTVAFPATLGLAALVLAATWGG